ncbi:MAG: hypothetical protein KDA45_01515 [Planctomycetales bacterium]|nr:hypothetical protein [Planctomycetales bacterium]
MFIPVFLGDVAGLRRWTALSAIALLVATWPLWTLTSEFPAIPFLQQLCDVPPIVDRCLLGVLLLGLGLLTLAPERWARLSGLAVLLVGLALLALDQHRFQPWFYQLMLFMAVMLVGDRRFVWQWLQALVISIYFFSALGKLDYEFLHTVGQQFLAATVDLLGLGQPPPAAAPSVAVAVLPLAELILACGLAVPSTRRWFGVVACLFHGLLIAILGPWGLDHSAGVLLWNAQFAVQAILLFVLPLRQPAPVPAHGRRTLGLGKMAAATVVGLAMLLPWVERFGYWDHWPSWALYAPHSSRAEVWIAQTAIDRLPASLQNAMAEDAGEAEDEFALWVRLPIERWSLLATRTPIYPQSRFQLGVALALAQRVQSEFHLKVRLLSAANRLNGSRQVREFVGIKSLAEPQRWFWCNTRPRPLQQ